MLLLKLLLFCQPLLVDLICDLRLTRDIDTFLDRWAVGDALPPFVQVGKGSKVNAGEERNVNPLE